MYLGNQPALSYTSFAKQDFTTSATTSYTLDQPVANENEIALFINFVRQEPTTAYSASGTTLTLTSATSASDDMYCVFLGKAVQTVNPPNGSVGTAQLGSTLDFSSKTITLASNMKNTPAFSAYLSSIQSISDSTLTTILYNAEQVDTDNAYDTSTGKFTPQTAGKYFVTFSAIGQSGQNSNADFIFGYIKKNTTTVGSTIVDFRSNPGRAGSITTSAIVSMNGTTDFLLTEIYITGNFSGSGLQIDVNSNFQAYKIIE